MITLNAKVDLAIALGKTTDEPDDIIWGEFIMQRRCYIDPSQMLRDNLRDAFVKRPDGREMVAEVRLLLPISPTRQYISTFLALREHLVLARVNDETGMFYLLSIKKIAQLYVSFFGIRYDKQGLVWV